MDGSKKKKRKTKLQKAIDLVNNSGQEIMIETDFNQGYSISFAMLIESSSEKDEFVDALMTVFPKLKAKLKIYPEGSNY